MKSKKKYALQVRIGSNGLHLFNRVTGINILVDEMSFPSVLWSTAPRQMSLAVTNDCDLSCSYCYAPKQHAMLEFERLTNWLIELDSNGCMGIGIGGGEPTLYPKLVELCSFITCKTKMAVIITTHAHRLSEQLLGDLEGKLNFVRVSVDGIGTTYESMRNCPFSILVERIKAISRITKFGINYIVNSRTIGDIDTAVQFAIDLGASELLFIPEVPVGQGKIIDDQTANLFKDWICHYRDKIPISVSEGSAEGLPICNPLVSEHGLAAFAHIDAMGIVKRTSYDKEGVPIGDDGVMAAIKKLSVTRKE
jgi:MoaA/NifB/PqqE/SkfB family radical SAM enzyme